MADRALLARHAALMDRMATTQGLDLEEKVLRAELRPDDLVDMVLSCTNCTSPGACQVWLDQAGTREAQTPSYCRNSDAFARLVEQ